MLPAPALKKNLSPTAEPPGPPPANGHYTPAQAARLLGVSYDTITRALDCGKLPGLKLLGRWRIPTSAVHALLREGNPDA